MVLPGQHAINLVSVSEEVVLVASPPTYLHLTCTPHVESSVPDTDICQMILLREVKVFLNPEQSHSALLWKGGYSLN